MNKDERKFSSVHVVDEKPVDFLHKENDFESSETGDSSHGKAEDMVLNDIRKDGNAEFTKSKDHVGNNQHMSEKTIDQELKSQKLESENSDDAHKWEGTESKTIKHSGKKKTRGKKGKSQKKELEMEDWLDKEDDYDYYVHDESYNEDRDDVIADGEMEDFNDDLGEEKPLDETDELFEDEQVDRKLKEKENLQEEIKQLKGFFFILFIFSVNCVVPENIHTPPTEGIGNSGGVGGSKA